MTIKKMKDPLTLRYVQLSPLVLVKYPKKYVFRTSILHVSGSQST
jgi:hypothetical protein